MSEKQKRIDFLYDEDAIKEENQEAYLLGKRFNFKSNDDDMRQLEDKGVAGSAFLQERNQVSSFIDRQNKVFSDPVLAIQKRQMEARKKILMNRHTMKKLRAKTGKKKKKKKKKKSKKKKKKKKRRRSSSSESDSSDSERDDSRSRKRRRDSSEEASPPKKRRKYSSESESESEDRPPVKINPLELYDKGTKFGLLHPKGTDSAAIKRMEKAKKKKKKKKKKKTIEYPTAWKKQGEHVEKFIRSKPRWRTTIEQEKAVKEMTSEEMERKVSDMETKARNQEKAREKALLQRDKEIKEERKQFMARKYVPPDVRTAEGFIHAMEKQAYGAGVDDDLEERLRKHQTRTQRGNINNASFMGGRTGGY